MQLLGEWALVQQAVSMVWHLLTPLSSGHGFVRLQSLGQSVGGGGSSSSWVGGGCCGGAAEGSTLTIPGLQCRSAAVLLPRVGLMS